jgi:hypothetical protein
MFDSFLVRPGKFQSKTDLTHSFVHEIVVRQHFKANLKSPDQLFQRVSGWIAPSGLRATGLLEALGF